MLKIKYSSNLEDNYYKEIAKSKADKFNGLTFEEYYNKHYKKFLTYELKEILCGNFEKLIEIKNKLGKKDDNKNKPPDRFCSQVVYLLDWGYFVWPP